MLWMKAKDIESHEEVLSSVGFISSIYIKIVRTHAKVDTLKIIQAYANIFLLLLLLLFVSCNAIRTKIYEGLKS